MEELKKVKLNIDNPEYTLSVNLPKPKSKIMIGSNTVIFNDRHFNWFQKKMWRLLLGIKIEDVEE